jgi:hypothetical protein
VFEPRTAVFEPRTAVFEPRTAVLEPRTAVFEPRTAVFEPRTAVFEPRTAKNLNLLSHHNGYCRPKILEDRELRQKFSAVFDSTTYCCISAIRDIADVGLALTDTVTKVF